jgi:hypothetical protein
MSAFQLKADIASKAPQKYSIMDVTRGNTRDGRQRQ